MNYLKEYLKNLYVGFKLLFLDIIDYNSYITNPKRVFFIMAMIMVFHVPLIFVLIYGLLIMLDVSINIENDKINTTEIQTLEIPYKTENGIKTIPITVENTIVVGRKESVYELMFNQHNPILIKGFDELDAIERAALTSEQKSDLVGIVIQ